jgi:hypothetical protein
MQYRCARAAECGLDRAIYAAPKLAAKADESVILYQQQGTFT